MTTVTKGRLPRVEFNDEADTDTLTSVLQGWAVEVVTKKTSPHRGQPLQLEVQGQGEDAQGEPVLLGFLLDEQYEIDVRFDDIKKIIIL